MVAVVVVAAEVALGVAQRVLELGNQLKSHQDLVLPTQMEDSVILNTIRDEHVLTGSKNTTD